MISQKCADLSNPRDGDYVDLTYDTVDVVASLSGWPSVNLRRMLANPIRYAEPKVSYGELHFGEEFRYWSLSWHWAVEGLSEAQMEILRRLPNMVEDEFGNILHRLVYVKPIAMTKDDWEWKCTCGRVDIFSMNPELAKSPHNLQLRWKQHDLEEYRKLRNKT